MRVQLLWHVRHAENRDGSPTQHREPSGELLVDEEYDNVKLIGVYSGEDAVRGAIERARLRPGFRDEPDCFLVDSYTLGQDNWEDGFVSLPHRD